MTGYHIISDLHMHLVQMQVKVMCMRDALNHWLHTRYVGRTLQYLHTVPQEQVNHILKYH